MSIPETPAEQLRRDPGGRLNTLRRRDAEQRARITELERMVRSMEERRADNKCPCCLTDERTRALVSCGHLLCTECLIKVLSTDHPRCPMCRQCARESIRVYL
jgi:hypothetical protein